MKLAKIVIVILLSIIALGIVRNRMELHTQEELNNINTEEKEVLPVDNAENEVESEPSIEEPTSTPIASYTPGKIEVLNIVVDGISREALVYIPKSLDSPKGASTIFVFHGGGGTADKTYDRLESIVKEISEKEEIVFVFPDAGGRSWYDGRPEANNGIDDISFTRSLKSELISRYKLDSDKFFVTGASNGGMFTQWIACTEPSLFAGYAPIIANLVTQVEPICKNIIAKPMLFIHGSADTFMPFEGGTIKSSERLEKGSGGTVISADATMDYWATKLSCEEPSLVSTINNDPNDGTIVKQYTWTSCQLGSKLERYVVEGGGHTWFGTPQNKLSDRIVGLSGTEIDVLTEVVAFFKRFGL